MFLFQYGPKDGVMDTVADVSGRRVSPNTGRGRELVSAFQQQIGGGGGGGKCHHRDFGVGQVLNAFTISFFFCFCVLLVSFSSFVSELSEPRNLLSRPASFVPRDGNPVTASFILFFFFLLPRMRYVVLLRTSFHPVYLFFFSLYLTRLAHERNTG